MKNKLFFAGMAALALTFGLVMTGCDNGSGGGGGGDGGGGGGGTSGGIPKELVGKWGLNIYGTKSQVLEIKSDGSGTTGAKACKWSVSGTKLTGIVDGLTGTVTYNITGGKLKFSDGKGDFGPSLEALTSTPLEKL
jgi:hypothetical protein